MSNRRKTRERRLKQTIENQPRKKLSAQHELSKIELFKQYAALEGHQVKES